MHGLERIRIEAQRPDENGTVGHELRLGDRVVCGHDAPAVQPENASRLADYTLVLTVMDIENVIRFNFLAHRA